MAKGEFSYEYKADPHGWVSDVDVARIMAGVEDKVRQEKRFGIFKKSDRQVENEILKEWGKAVPLTEIPPEIMVCFENVKDELYFGSRPAGLTSALMQKCLEVKYYCQCPALTQYRMLVDVLHENRKIMATREITANKIGDKISYSPHPLSPSDRIRIFRK